MHLVVALLGALALFLYLTLGVMKKQLPALLLLPLCNYRYLVSSGVYLFTGNSFNELESIQAQKYGSSEKLVGKNISDMAV